MTEVTQILTRSRSGDADALKMVYEVLFHELELAARAQLRRHAEPALQTHALINESFLKLVDQNDAGLESRDHFMAVAATAMRHVLIDQYRRESAHKRGGVNRVITLVEENVPGMTPEADLLALDAALTRLQRTDERLAHIVECKFFGGMGYEEIGAALGLSPRTIRKDWQKAKAWLALELSDGG